jgi:hypothetical protein
LENATLTLRHRRNDNFNLPILGIGEIWFSYAGAADKVANIFVGRLDWSSLVWETQS